MIMTFTSDAVLSGATRLGLTEIGGVTVLLLLFTCMFFLQKAYDPISGNLKDKRWAVIANLSGVMAMCLLVWLIIRSP